MCRKFIAWLGIVSIVTTDVAFAFQLQIIIDKKDIVCNNQDINLRNCIKINTDSTVLFNPKFIHGLELYDKVKLSSNLPITIESLNINTFNVNAPKINMTGKSCIDNLEVNISNNKGSLFIDGELKTKDFQIYGNTQINGTLNFLSSGRMKFDNLDSCTERDAIIINGKLNGKEKLAIETNGYICSISNNGSIHSEGSISFDVNTFTNNKNATFEAKESIFTTQCFLKNLGTLDTDTLTINPQQFILNDSDITSSPIILYQLGKMNIRQRAILNCNLVSDHITLIKHLIFPMQSSIDVTRGIMNIELLENSNTKIEIKKGAEANITKTISKTALIDNNGGRLNIKSLESKGYASVISQSSAKSTITEVDSKKSFFPTKNSNLTLGNSNNTSIYASDRGNVTVSGANNIDILTIGNVSSKIDNSTVETANILRSSKLQFSCTNATNVKNSREISVSNTKINNLINNGNANFKENTSTKELHNSNTVTFGTGNHSIEFYNGKSKISKLEVQGKPNTSTSNSKNSNIQLTSGNAKLDIKELSGYGNIKAQHQIYTKVIPTNFYIDGNANIITERIPEPREIPDNSGDLHLHTIATEDFLNHVNRSYRANLHIDMNGNSFKNKNASLSAEGLCIKNANNVINSNGQINTKNFYTVEAENFLNDGGKIITSNGNISINAKSAEITGKHQTKSPISAQNEKKIANIQDATSISNMYAGGSIKIETTKSLKLNNAVIQSKDGNITIDGKQGIVNSKGCQFVATNGDIYFAAAKQIHETVIQKAFEEYSCSKYGYHYEWIESVIRDAFIAKNITFAGNDVDLNGILIDAKRLYDETKNMLITGTKERLFYWSWAKKKTLFSRKSVGSDGYNDIFVPPFVSVDEFVSSGQKNSNGVTRLEMKGAIVNGKSQKSSLLCTKDIWKDSPLVVESSHKEWKNESGFSIGGSIRVHNPLDNMKGFLDAQKKTNLAITSKSIETIATTVRLCENAQAISKTLNKMQSNQHELNVTDYASLLSVIMNHISGPKLSIGSSSTKIRQNARREIGNKINIETIEANCPISVTLCGNYNVKTGKIRTKSFKTNGCSVIFDNSIEHNESGVQVDLLKAFVGFVIGYLTGNYSMLCSAVNVSCASLNGKSHQEAHIPTYLNGDLWDIKAENGNISHTQIIADTVKAIFQKNLTVEMLANTVSSSNNGFNSSVSGGILNAGNLVNTIGNLNVGIVDKAIFNKKIEEFASIVAHGELIIEANKLITNSTKIGDGDKSKEHLKIGQHIDTKAKEVSYSRDNSIQIDSLNFMSAVETIKNTVDEIFTNKDTSIDANSQRELLQKYAKIRYRKEIKNGVPHDKAIDAIKKDLPVVNEMFRQNEEIKKPNFIVKQNKKSIFSNSSSSSALKVEPNAFSLLMNKWKEQETDDKRTKAAKNIVLLNAAKLSENHTGENELMLQKAVQNLEKVSSDAFNGLCLILGAPQQTDALNLLTNIVRHNKEILKVIKDGIIWDLIKEGVEKAIEKGNDALEFINNYVDKQMDSPPKYEIDNASKFPKIKSTTQNQVNKQMDSQLKHEINNASESTKTKSITQNQVNKQMDSQLKYEINNASKFPKIKSMTQDQANKQMDSQLKHEIDNASKSQKTKP